MYHHMMMKNIKYQPFIKISFLTLLLVTAISVAGCGQTAPLKVPEDRVQDTQQF